MAVKFAIDTSAYSMLKRGDQRMKRWFNEDHQVVVSMIVLGELRAGFGYGNQQSDNERVLEEFLSMPNVQIVSLTDKTTHYFADIYRTLRRKGRPIGTDDIWIAANCLEHNLPLLTLDKDFTHVKGLELLPL